MEEVKKTPQRRGSYIEVMFKAKYGNGNNKQEGSTSISKANFKRCSTLPTHVTPVSPSKEKEVERPLRRSKTSCLEASRQRRRSSNSQKTTTKKIESSNAKPLKRSSGGPRGSSSHKKTTSRSSEKTTKKQPSSPPSSPKQRGSRGSKSGAGSIRQTRRKAASKTLSTALPLHLQLENQCNMSIKSLHSLPEVPVSALAPHMKSHDMSFKSLPDMPSSPGPMISDIDKVLMLPQAALLSLLQKSEDVIGGPSITMRDRASMPARLSSSEDESPKPHQRTTTRSRSRLRKIQSLPTSLDEQRNSEMDLSERSDNISTLRKHRRRTIDDVIPDLRGDEPPKNTTSVSATANKPAAVPAATLRNSGSIPKEALAGPVNPWIAQLGSFNRCDSEELEGEVRSGFFAMSA